MHLTPKTFFRKIIKLILWSNLAQKFFDLAKSKIFMPRQNRVSNGSRPRMWNLGRVKVVTSNRERTFRLFQSGPQFCKSIGAILLHKPFAGTPQSTQPPSLWPTKKRQPNTGRWMLEKNSNELRRKDSKAKICSSQRVIRYNL